MEVSQKGFGYLMVIEINERNERIFQAAKKQFALNGYHQTSTNLIAETADVSKALVFHHFQSKKKLYLTVIEHSIDLMIASFEEVWHPSTSSDFFDQMKYFVKAKMEVATRYPIDNILLMQAYMNQSQEINKELQEIFIEKSKAIQTLSDETIFELLTPQTIRTNVEVDYAKKLIRSVFNAFSQQILSNYNGRYEDMIIEQEEILSEMDAIINILKYGVSKT